MKFNKNRSITLLFALLIVYTMQAQGNIGRLTLDPVAQAHIQTEKMIEQLDLSTAQGKKIKAVNLEFAQKIITARSEATEARNWSILRESRKTLQVEKKAAIDNYLTTKQSKKWEQLQTVNTEKKQEKNKDKG